MAAELGLEPGSFGVLTLHRPSNVDDARSLGLIVDQLLAVARVPRASANARPADLQSAVAEALGRKRTRAVIEFRDGKTACRGPSCSDSCG
jgi:hypothetical protein